MAFAGTRRAVPVEREVVPVPPEVVEKFWKNVRGAVHWHKQDHSRIVDYDDERLHQRLLLGRDLAWLVVHPGQKKLLAGVVLTTISERPPSTRKIFGRERALTVHLAAGIQLESWIEQAAERITAYGQAHDCRELFVLARKGWKKYMQHFFGRGWNKVAYSHDRPNGHGGRHLCNRVGYYRQLDPPEVSYVPQRQ